MYNTYDDPTMRQLDAVVKRLNGGEKMALHANMQRRDGVAMVLIRHADTPAITLTKPSNEIAGYLFEPTAFSMYGLFDLYYKETETCYTVFFTAVRHKNAWVASYVPNPDECLLPDTQETLNYFLTLSTFCRRGAWVKKYGKNTANKAKELLEQYDLSFAKNMVLLDQLPKIDDDIGFYAAKKFLLWAIHNTKDTPLIPPGAEGGGWSGLAWDTLYNRHNQAALAASSNRRIGDDGKVNDNLPIYSRIRANIYEATAGAIAELRSPQGRGRRSMRDESPLDSDFYNWLARRALVKEDENGDNVFLLPQSLARPTVGCDYILQLGSTIANEVFCAPQALTHNMLMSRRAGELSIQTNEEFDLDLRTVAMEADQNIRRPKNYAGPWAAENNVAMSDEYHDSAENDGVEEDSDDNVGNR